MPTTSSRSTKRVAPKVPVAKSITNWFQQWRGVKDEVEQLGERQGELRDRLVDTIAEVGYEDEKGNWWFDFDEPISFTNHKGKVFQYTALKRERHLSPAQPTPDPAKAKTLLKKKGFWLTEEQEKAVKELKIQCPYAVISVAVDPDAVASLLFKDLISDKEYESTLKEQTETFQFRPAES